MASTHKLKEQVVQEITQHIVRSIISFLILPLILSLWINERWILNWVAPTILYHTLLVAVLVMLIEAAYIIFLRKKLKNPFDDFDYDVNTGILTNKKDGLRYCLSCQQKGLKSPLKREDTGWRCLNKDCYIYYKE